MSDWDSYSLQDFIPFTAEVYFRQLARMGESFWPLQWLALAAGLAALVLAVRGRPRIALLIIAPWWAFIGLAYFMQRYAQLNWAGTYIGWLFVGESLLLSAAAITGAGCAHRAAARTWKKPIILIALAMVLGGMIGLPVAACIASGEWHGAAVFGLTPDSTAVVSLGVLMIALKGAVKWGAALLPVMWLTVSGLTLQVLQVSWADAIFLFILIGFAGLLWKAQ